MHYLNSLFKEAVEMRVLENGIKMHENESENSLFSRGGKVTS